VKRIASYLSLGLVLLVLGTASVIALRHFGMVGPGKPQVDVGGMILKSVRELLQVTVLEMPMASDPSHPTESRRALGCLGNMFCVGSYWAVFDWQATLRMSYDLSAAAQTSQAGSPFLTQIHSNAWQVHLPPVTVDVDLQAEHINFRTRRVGALLNAQQAASWEQELFQATRKSLSACFERDPNLRQRAQDALATKLHHALQPLLAEYQSDITLAFADEASKPLTMAPEQHHGRINAAARERPVSLPHCGRLLLALHAP
jgi:hypothetical protein